MITRAQAEALLTLAESLEACERVGLNLVIPARDLEVHMPGGSRELDLSGAYFDGSSIRTAVADLMPKHTGS